MIQRLRRISQHVLLLAVNSHFLVSSTHPIYQGRLKYACIPVLNCYSCPLAVFSCPIGAIQSTLATLRPMWRAGIGVHIGAYTMGILGMVGALIGRMPCAWACPFGLLQEYLYKIRTKKFEVPRWMGNIRFIILALLVILLPLILTDKMGYGETTFCKYLCPAGTLEAGIPLVSLQPGLRRLVGILFGWKILVLITVVVFSILTSRPFCRTLCPLGAVLGLFNKVSLLKLRHDPDTCVECGACRTICPTGVSFFDGTDSPNSSSCIRCLRCYSICPVCAIDITTGTGKKVIQCEPRKSVS